MLLENIYTSWELKQKSPSKLRREKAENFSFTREWDKFFLPFAKACNSPEEAEL